MNKLFLGTVFAFIACSGTAIAGSQTFGGFVTGSTTVADVEQRLGAPVNTTVQADGALTLVYPVSRVSNGTETSDAQGLTIAMHFGTDFILRNVIVTEAILVTGNRFAAK
jgi:hypothetical protein